MINIILPWPSKDLSPNGRVHWSVLARAKKAYRNACWALALEAHIKAPESERINIQMTFYRPARYEYDKDNLIARMKSGLDGLADAMGVNDSRFEILPPVIAEEIGGMVKVKVSPA